MPDLITREDFEAQITTNFDAAFSENINQIVSQVKLLEDSIDEQVLDSHLKMFIKSVLFYEVPEELYQEVLDTLSSRIQFITASKNDDGNINIEYEYNITKPLRSELRVYENNQQTCRMTLEYEDDESSTEDVTE